MVPRATEFWCVVVLEIDDTAGLEVCHSEGNASIHPRVEVLAVLPLEIEQHHEDGALQGYREEDTDTQQQLGFGQFQVRRLVPTQQRDPRRGEKSQGMAGANAVASETRLRLSKSVIIKCRSVAVHVRSTVQIPPGFAISRR